MKAETKQIGPYQLVELKRLDPGPKASVLSLRVSADLKHRMGEACDAGPYHIGISALVTRGIELAIKELETLRATLK